MPESTLISWPQPLVEFLGFVATFLATGAVGFRLFVLHSVLHPASPEEELSTYRKAGQRAAVLGLGGALALLGLLAAKLPEMAARAHVGIGALIVGNAAVAAQCVLALVTALGLALAAARRSGGWLLAMFGVFGGALRMGLFGQWARVVNPMHVLAGGMWIGTLFMLIFVGVATVLASPLPSERRGGAVADLVEAFSPYALLSAAVLALFGLITAWRHLHQLSALWTTPYGIALIVKLCVVAGVLALGAWNWRRVKPSLGTEAAARSLRRSATAELAVAAIVLAITAVLVSLPSPRPPATPPPTAYSPR